MSFDKRAKNYGHSADALAKGHEVSSNIQVNSIDELRAHMDGHGSKAARKAHMEAFQQTHADALGDTSADIGNLHTRAAAAVFGTHALSKDDTLMLKSNFPLTVQVMSVVNKTVDGVWDLGTNGPPAVFNIGTLTINPGGSIRAVGTAVTLTCDKVVNNASGGGGAPYTIGIFGDNGSAGANGGSGTSGSDGQAGSNAGTPSPGICTGARTPTAGGNGQPGGNGGDGQVGGDGSPNQPASFNFTTVSGNPIILATTSGAGGVGGLGGPGGNGGNGGKGGDGCQSGCEGTASANGGNGGSGGKGGDGGAGGNAANGQPINVVLGKGVDTSVIVKSSQVASPGKGGAQGIGGTGGQGGAGGTGSGKHRSGGSQGQPSPHGANGSNGSQGKQVGQPGSITVVNAN